MNEPAEAVGHERLDPVFTRSLYEAWLILAIWTSCLCWCVGYCWLNGFEVQGQVTIVFGMPSWIFWGVLLPWLLATTASIVIGLFVVDDQPLGEDADDIGQEVTDA